MLSRRETTPSTAVPPSLEASYQSQLNDLVQRNQALEQSNRSLSEDLTAEALRSKAAALEIKQQWHLEQRQWSRAWGFLQCSYRVVRYGTEVELQNERISLLKESNALRKEKLARLNRDYRITSFQIRERELESRIYELENAKEELTGERDDEVRSLLQQNTSLQSQLSTQTSALAIMRNEKDKVESTLSALREEYARSQASTDALGAKVERAVLQLDGEKTKYDDLHRAHEELKHINIDLKRQLAKWQHLEDKGNSEADSLRKQRIELEIALKDLRNKMDQQTTTHKETLERETEISRGRKAEIKDLTLEIESLKQEHTKAATQLIDAQRQIDELIIRLGDRYAPHKAPNRHHGESPDPNTSTSVNSATDDIDPAPDRPLRRPRAKREADTTSNELKRQKRCTKPGDVKTQPADTLALVSEEPDKIDPASRITKNKRSRKKGDSATFTLDVIGIPQGGQASGGDIAGGPSKRQDQKQPHAVGNLSQAKQQQPEGTPSEDEETVKRKKRRKINVFPTAPEPTVFEFTQEGTDGGLNIPTMLSPVKRSVAVPGRSGSGSVLGSLIGKRTFRRA